ncbi:hypothetical protein SAMN05444266_102528 [Chitinophaga jiangningensis]|uniref:Glycosyl hydrolase family 65, N-terminal domain n=1 Tax=Chitinophaga jiangningensis TaxID=1419482 RepID=A0A1M6YXH3_9BACT|nr:hypothetical protein [Chitinophaga jiangningensis]SHL22803.1 hypothetical protein SAMN05444266_102528 [Chitinophaga jiangningensis]
MRTCIIVLLLGIAHLSDAQSINRRQVVTRHNVQVQQIDSLSSLSVGNGQFAFTVDATGMQSFPALYAGGVPLGTQSEWGWHSFPNTHHYKFEETLRNYDLQGKQRPYSVQIKSPDRSREACDYFRVNPHRLQLGSVGMEITLRNNRLATAADIKDIRQQLDVYTGIITSKFTVEGVPVEVTTSCHQERDMVGFHVESPLLAQSRLRVLIRVPEPAGGWKDAADNFKGYTKLNTELRDNFIACSADTSQWFIGVAGNASLVKAGLHAYEVKPAGAKGLDFTVQFTEKRTTNYMTADQVDQSSIAGWKHFWESGAAVDFAGSKDPRAKEIERRVVLSEYLTKLQCSGNFPPQETGLTYNSWYGKPHLEMHWWHAVHFALWGRPELMEKSLDWYRTVSAKAEQLAQRQHYSGLRWQKMVDHSGDESPSSVGAFLIWQQPHFIYMTELLYQSRKQSAEVIKKYADLVYKTAEFMADYASYDSVKHRYNLGPGLIPAQECFDPLQTFNPTYELAYWHWALQTAQQWRERAGLPRVAKWDAVCTQLAPLPVLNGVYLPAESNPDGYTNSRYLGDHPAVLGAYASIPGSPALDTATMLRTLNLVWDKWRWNDTWGWDFPLTAMAATRLHQPEMAVQALLKPIRTNTYLVNGHNFQDERLTIYLPGNGGLLSAIAMMCAGTAADPTLINGFPDNGQWKVKCEGFTKIF